MKKILSLSLCVLIVFSLSSCNKNSEKKTSTANTTTSEIISSDDSVSSKEQSTISDIKESSALETSSIISSEASKITSSSEVSSANVSSENNKQTVSSSPVSSSLPAENSTPAPKNTPVNSKPAVQSSKPSITIPAFSEEINKKLSALSNKKTNFSWAYPEPDNVLNPLGAYTHGDLNKNILYLTFDEGYEYNNQTAKILDILKEKQVKAVFFVTLSYVKSNPHYIKRMIAEGHVVGNHSVSHPNMTSISLQNAYNEVKGLHDYMLKNFNYTMHLFRFPEGTYSHRILEMIKQMGYKSVFWNFGYKDWDTSNQPDVAESKSKVLSYAKNGTLFLLHACSSTDMTILPDVIDGARQKGFTFGLFS